MPSILGHPSDKEFDLYRDGTTIYSVANSASWSTLSQWAQGSILNVNDWNLGTNVLINGENNSSKLAIFFPEPRTITAYSFSLTIAGSMSNIETSSDAMSPDTGTWTLRHSGTFHGPWTSTSDISQVRVPLTVSWTNVKALRFTGSTGNSGYIYILEMHYWGTYTQAGLEFYDSVLDEKINASTFDYGEIQQGTINDRQFRIKNNSAQTANDVTLTVGGNGTGSLPANITYSNGGAYSSSLNIGTLAPGAISTVITVRRTVAGNAALQYGASRLIATATSWT